MLLDCFCGHGKRRISGHRQINFETLKHDAVELPGLAPSIPSDVDRTTKGTLLKDLSTKLKRIETLAKQFRTA